MNITPEIEGKIVLSIAVRNRPHDPALGEHPHRYKSKVILLSSSEIKKYGTGGSVAIELHHPNSSMKYKALVRYPHHGLRPDDGKRVSHPCTGGKCLK